MQKIFIPIIIFIAVLIALVFGEGLLATLLNFLEDIFSFLWGYWQFFYRHIIDFITQNPYKVVLALIITIIASFWVFSQRSEELNRPANRRKLSIVLAIFLGWLGAHRFYLGQFAWGVFYIILSLIFTPLTVLISFIDAARFIFYSDEEFSIKYPLSF